MRPGSCPDDPIGVLDSGLGGLAVVREMLLRLPAESLLYVADTARRPFELRPPDQVRDIAVELVGFLAASGVKLVVFGCHTATSTGLAAVAQAFPDLPLVGMVEPGARAAARVSRRHRYGVVASTVTLGTGAWEDALRRADPRAQVEGASPVALVRRAEQLAIQDRAAIRRLVEYTLEPMDEFGVDTVVLACTDLTWVRDVFDEVAAGRFAIVDPAQEVVREARDLLFGAGFLRPADASRPRRRFLVTGDDTPMFAKQAAQLLGTDRVDARFVDPGAVRAATEVRR